MTWSEKGENSVVSHASPIVYDFSTIWEANLIKWEFWGYTDLQSLNLNPLGPDVFQNTELQTQESNAVHKTCRSYITSELQSTIP